MAKKTIDVRHILRNDTSAKWKQVNPVLYQGEIGIENDTYKFKIGNGSDAWNDLDYATSGAAAADVTVDNETIELSKDGELRLANFGVKYYKWVEGTDDSEGYYELQMVDETHPWIAGLEPKVVSNDSGFEIAWYEPSATTIEGLQDIVGTVTTELDKVKDSVFDIKNLVGTQADNDVNTVWGAINENASDIAKLNGKISGVFHFKGAAPDGGLDAIIDKEIGDVYTVDEAEFAWSGSEWIELGATVDLSEFETRLNNIEKDSHKHVNKQLLDEITEDRISNWDDAKPNVIEVIKADGVDLPVVGKTVDIPAATAVALGLVKVDNDTIESINGVISVKAVGISKVYVEDDTELILNGGDSSMKVSV